jgi:hypothetical protein
MRRRSTLDSTSSLVDQEGVEMYKAVICGIIVLGILVIFSVPAYAYLDPGTGSLILQGIIGTIAAGFAFFSLFFQRIKKKLSGWISGYINTRTPSKTPTPSDVPGPCQD